MRGTRLIIAAGTGMLASAPGAGLAQTGGHLIEEVVVTASKRPENVQRVPTAVSVITPKLMERESIRTFDDLVNIVPSLTITKTTQPANNSINIRGIGTYAFSPAVESSVAVVVDDVPQAFQAQAFTSLVDIAQVEVLRGPQSTLFGKSASAGVISVTTQAPTNHWTALLDAMFTNDDEERVAASVSGPLTDQLKFRLTGDYSNYDGNVYDISLNKKLNGARDETLRGKLEWTPGEHWDVTVIPYANKTWASCCVGGLSFISPGMNYAGLKQLPESVVLAGIAPGPGNTTVRNDAPPWGLSYEWGGSTREVYRWDGYSLTSITAYDHYNLRDWQDVDNTDINFFQLPGAAPNVAGQPGGLTAGGHFDVAAVTQEFRLTSPNSDVFNYVGGVFYSDSSIHRYFLRGPAVVPTTTSNGPASYYTTSGDANYAAYGNATWTILPKLSVVGGLRINKEDIDYVFTDIIAKKFFSGANSDTALTGRGGLQYQWTPDVMTFVTYARGYKGQTYDLTSSFNALIASQQPIKAETADDWEVGIKSTILDNRAIVNLTAFNTKFYNFQAQTRNFVTTLFELENVGVVRTRGIELDSTVYLTEDLSLTAGGSYDEATIQRFPIAQCYANQTVAQGCVGGQQNLNGRPLNNAPKLNLNVNGQYEFPIASMPFNGFVVAGYRWQSKVYYSLQQDPDSLQPAYGIADLQGGIEDQNGRYKITGFANNLFDKRYALTAGRDVTYWTKGAPVGSDAVTWKPARDSFRYFGVRLTLNY